MLASYLNKTYQTCLINCIGSLLGTTAFYFFPGVFSILFVVLIIQINFWWSLQQKGISYKWTKISVSLLLTTNIALSTPFILFFFYYFWIIPLFIYHFMKEIVSFHGLVLRKQALNIYLLSLLPSLIYIYNFFYSDSNPLLSFNFPYIFTWLLFTNIIPQFIQEKLPDTEDPENEL